MIRLGNYNNVINICGSGRNVGKTFLGESIISSFSKDNDIVAIKISKFKHKNHQNDCLKMIHRTSYYTIWQEMAFSNKDSGRYLKAGAKLSFYIESDDTHLLESFLYVKKHFCKSCLIICESASISKYIYPAVSIFVESINHNTEKNKLRYLNISNIVLKEQSIEISMPQLFLNTKKNEWILKYSKNTAYYAKC
jgi:molybdopterin-guanine dinucleotide biosynthesis protein